jgi:mannose-1-phosphate guanylyltransferase/mannose-6-phosphate isomerase
MSLLQLTILRNKIFGRITVITNKEYKFIVMQQAEEIGAKIGRDIDIILEPVARNTAGCSIVSSLLCADDIDTVVLFIPADHYIDDNDSYTEETSLVGRKMSGEPVFSGLPPAAATPRSRNDDPKFDNLNVEVLNGYTEETSSCARKMSGELAEPTLVGEHKRIPKFDNANNSPGVEVLNGYTEETSLVARKMSGELAEPTLVGEHKRIPKFDNANNEVSKVYELCIRNACMHAHSSGDIAMIGIKPTTAHTGYGYIKAQKTSNTADVMMHIESFVEKPSFDAAMKYLHDGNYYWNAGIFMYTPKVMLSVANAHVPQILSNAYLSVQNAVMDRECLLLQESSYSDIQAISIDYAIIEKIQNIAMVEASFNWSDLGNWSAIYDITDKNHQNNAIVGEVFTKDSNNNYIYSPHAISTIVGVNNMIIVNTKDALLIADKNMAEEVKQCVHELTVKERKEVLNAPICYRPWGEYIEVDHGDLHLVKRIIVKPGHKLSLQYHHHRAEHWVIVRGIAEVQIGEEYRRLSENDSIYIPKGMRHRLSNIGEIDLHVIEVQTGGYLEEDDIVRIGDQYGR